MREMSVPDARGINGIQRWQEIAKGGGVAPSATEIQDVVCTKRTKPYTREELRKKIAEYFQDCTTVETDPDTGEEVVLWKTAPTKSRLALKLGLSSQTMLDYIHAGHGAGHGMPYQGRSKKQLVDESDFDLLQNAYLLIQSYYEGLLSLNRNNSGSIFWLLNSSRSEWKNESNVNLSAEQRQIDVPEISTEEISNRYQNAQLMPPEEGVLS